MKKILNILLIGVLVGVLTGCATKEAKEQTLVCTTTKTENGLNIEQVISMTYKNDKLKHMIMEVNKSVTDSTIKEKWEEYKEFMDKDNQEFNKDGISLKVITDDQNYKYNTILDIDTDNVTEEDLKEQGFVNLKDDTSTLESIKESSEKYGASCIIK